MLPWGMSQHSDKWSVFMFGMLFSLKIVFIAKFLIGRKVHSQNHTVDVAVTWYTPQPFGYGGSSKFAC